MKEHEKAQATKGLAGRAAQSAILGTTVPLAIKVAKDQIKEAEIGTPVGPEVGADIKGQEVYGRRSGSRGPNPSRTKNKLNLEISHQKRRSRKKKTIWEQYMLKTI